MKGSSTAGHLIGLLNPYLTSLCQETQCHYKADMVMTPEHQSQDNTPIQQPALKEKVDRSRLIILTGDKKWSVVQASAEFSGKGK